MTTFQIPCGCLLSLDGGQNEPCPIHDIEGLTPKGAMIVFLRVALMGETDEEAVAYVRTIEAELAELENEGIEADRPEDLPVPPNADKRFEEFCGG